MNDAAKDHMDAWAVEDVGARVAARIVCPTTGAPIASLGGGAAGGNASIHEFDHLVSVRVKHARLMAAAPDLLSALVGMFDLHEPEGRFQPSHYKTPLFKARKAIAKAMGIKESEVTEALAARWKSAQL